MIHSLALSAQGRQPEAIKELRRLVARNPKYLDDAVNVLTIMHEPLQARELLGRTDRQVSPKIEAKLLFEEGHLRRALELAEGSSTSLTRQIRGELSLLDVDTRLRTVVPERGIRPTERRCVRHIVTTALPEAVSGYTVRTQGIARAQAEIGWDVQVFPRLGFPVDQGNPSAANAVDVDGVTYLRTINSGIPISAGERVDRMARHLIERLRREPATVLHAHSKHDNAQAALLAGRTLDIPVIYEVRGMLEETWLARGGSAEADYYQLARQAETTCMLAADAVVTLSEAMRAEIISRGVSAASVHVIPNAIEPSGVQEPIQRSVARERLGLNLGELVIGTASTFNVYEDLDLLIKAIAKLRNLRVTLLLVGDGPMRASLEAQALELGVRVVLTGRVPPAEVRAYVSALDLFCVPRRASPLTNLVPPMKPLEALASGVPLLVSDLPPLEEIAKESGAGWTAAAGDVDAWTRQLRRLLATPEALEVAGRAGYGWVMEERTWRKAAIGYEQVYAALDGR